MSDDNDFDTIDGDIDCDDDDDHPSPVQIYKGARIESFLTFLRPVFFSDVYPSHLEKCTILHLLLVRDIL